MNRPSCPVAFFDIGDTLARVRLSPTGGGIDDLTVYPGVHAVLKALADEGVRLGILSDRGAVPEDEILAWLERDEVLARFDRSLIVFGSKSSPAVFKEAADRVARAEGCREATLLYIGENASERARAGAAGFLTAPHPALALSVLLRPSPLRYLRIRVPEVSGTGDWRARLRDLPLVPLHMAAEPGAAVAIYAIGDAATAAALDDLGFWVDRLGTADEPRTSDLYLLRDDLRAEGGFLSPTGNSSAVFGSEPAGSRLLASTRAGLLVAVPAGESVERFHFHHTQHGHTVALTPSMTLLAPTADVPRAAAAFIAPSPDPLCDREKGLLAGVVTDTFLDAVVARYTGTGANSAGAGIQSRHIHHPGNAQAVDALVDALGAIAPGFLTVSRHCFEHDQRMLTNVVATLPASGPDVEGVVVVSAHLDSTAGEVHPYCGSVDPAPGADDDASGIGGVLAAAHACARLAALRPRRREMRFVLFNCEEHGRKGSGAYSRAEAALGTKIEGVFQLDMIGYDREPPPHFELHAGFDIPEAPNADHARDRSAELAALVARLREEVSPNLPEPQIFADSEDPAGGYSDHTEFHARGYPACLATEDFFPGHGAAGERNPNYHRPSDTHINPGYAADIARVVTAAAWMAATR